jgi:hypothetical protein
MFQVVDQLIQPRQNIALQPFGAIDRLATTQPIRSGQHFVFDLDQWMRLTGTAKVLSHLSTAAV